MAVHTATRTRVAHKASPLGLRGPGLTPKARASEGIMEAHAFLDIAGCDFLSDMHLLSQKIYSANSREEILAIVHRAASHAAEFFVKSKARLRAINREINGVAA